ncbi:hypothetical protein [Teichococcus aestuarii]|uniref:hypothetical protein n=1 Tax=Teichococcus aestuarii TaxID=568898 RepID=UPI003611E885
MEGMRAALRDLLGRAMADGSQTGPAMEAGCTAYAPGEAPPASPAARSGARRAAGASWPSFPARRPRRWPWRSATGCC